MTTSDFEIAVESARLIKILAGLMDGGALNGIRGGPMTAQGNHLARKGFVQISYSRRNAFEGEIEPGLALVERDDIREVSRGVNFPERLKSPLSGARRPEAVAALSPGKPLAPWWMAF